MDDNTNDATGAVDNQHHPSDDPMDVVPTVGATDVAQQQLQHHQQPSQQQQQQLPSVTLKISNLQSRLNPKVFNKVLTKHNIDMTGVKVTKQFNQPWAKLRFPSVEAKDAALAILRDTNLGGEVTHKGEPLNLEVVQQQQRQRQGEGDDQGVGGSDDHDGVNGPLPPKRRKVAETGAEGGEGNNTNTHAGGFAPKLTAEEAVCSWFAIPYEEQLQRKRKEMEQILYDISMRIKKECGTNLYPRWLRRVFDDAKANRSRALACPLENIVPSPLQSGYRNKTELTIGYNHGGELTAGFMLTAARHAGGVSTVGEPTDNCLSVSVQHAAIHRDIIVPLLKQSVVQFPQLASTPAWNRVSHQGFWRLALIRTTRDGDAMLVLQINPKDHPELSSTTDAVTAPIESWIVDFVKSKSDPALHRIVSLYVQHHVGVSDAAPLDAPLKLLWGNPTIRETVLGLQFDISPSSFFQVNTLATEVLYSQACEWAMEKLHLAVSPSPSSSNTTSPATTVLDVCCGTGTIGLCIASLAAARLNTSTPTSESAPSGGAGGINVIGVEIVPDAVRDAGRNAAHNGVSNISFIAGKAEDVIKGVLQPRRSGALTLDPATTLITGPGVYQVPADGGEVVAMVDPPRAGLHKKVIQALRDCPRIDRLIYVSCNQKALINDAIALCRPESNTYRGVEFVPTRAIAFDLFPHTPHCELVVLFERQQQESSTESTTAASVTTTTAASTTTPLPATDVNNTASSSAGANNSSSDQPASTNATTQ
jgi:tRNA (uracil-5-)-methyltransferase